MSDIEDHAAFQSEESDSIVPEVEDMPQVEDASHDEESRGIQSQHDFDDAGDEVDAEEDEEEQEQEEEEEEDLPGRKGRKRAKHRHKRSTASRFLDIEAEVSDDDEEDEEEEEDSQEPFIERDDDDASRRHHAFLDSKRVNDADDDKTLEQIAKDISKRYVNRAAVRYTGDMNEVPQRLLMPSVHDASLWQVRVKPGRERDIVFSLMRKSIDVEYTARPLQIVSAFQRDSLPGMIYVEARSSQQVSQACNGLVGIYPSRGIQLVPIEEMASLLQIKKQDLNVTPGSWVRIKRGRYQGDLAQVMDITENGEDVGLKFVPRIDLNPRDDGGLEGRKRKKGGPGPGTMRPPQRLFNYEEIVKVWGRKLVAKRNQVFVFQNDTYKDGFIEKDFKLSGLILEDVNPTLDEITQFTRRQDGAEADNVVDLSIIAEASRKAAISVLQPGDHIEVFEGEQSGVHGVVEEIAQDVVTITAVGVEIDGQKVVLPARSVRKRFKPGDHVKVMTGKNADETGLVVSVADNVVTFLSDMSMQEVSVFSKDLREAAEVGSGTNIVGNYELHDLVQLDLQTVGVIFKTERDSFRVLDQNGQVRLVQPHQISMRRDSNRAIATDSEGHELRINDNMKEIDGEGRKGRVLHIHQSFFAFLHNRDIVENGGVFVTRARSLASLAPKGNLVKTPGADLSKMNPALGAPTGGMVGSGNMGRGPRDRLIGVTVVVVKGTQKGYVGAIKDTNGPIARVELHTGNKVITIEKEKLYRKNPDGSIEPLEARLGSGRTMGPPRALRGSSRTPNPYASGGGRTPGWGTSGRTPNPYASGEARTPAWNASSRTPNPYADGGKTPAWNASSRTPNPYATDGGRTPAWNTSSRTPNPYGGSAGVNAGGSGAAAGGWGGATPGRNAGWSETTSKANPWGVSADSGWASPARQQPWSNEPHTWNAPTPAAAAATPGFNSAPTPAAASTPGVYSSQTPAGVWGAKSGTSAPTPGVSYSYSYEPDIRSYEPPELWLFDPAFTKYQQRIKVKVYGTRATGYRDGDYENKTGKILSASIVAPEFEQTALIKFDTLEDPISIQDKYISPVQPQHRDDEVLVLDGEHKGKVFIVREKPDRTAGVSTKQEPASIIEVSTDTLAALYPESTFGEVPPH